MGEKVDAPTQTLDGLLLGRSYLRCLSAPTDVNTEKHDPIRKCHDTASNDNNSNDLRWYIWYSFVNRCGRRSGKVSCGATFSPAVTTDRLTCSSSLGIRTIRPLLQ